MPSFTVFQKTLLRGNRITKVSIFVSHRDALALLDGNQPVGYVTTFGEAGTGKTALIHSDQPQSDSLTVLILTSVNVTEP
jgi:hypothetical protein